MKSLHSLFTIACMFSMLACTKPADEKDEKCSAAVLEEYNQIGETCRYFQTSQQAADCKSKADAFNNNHPELSCKAKLESGKVTTLTNETVIEKGLKGEGSMYTRGSCLSDVAGDYDAVVVACDAIESEATAKICTEKAEAFLIKWPKVNCALPKLETKDVPEKVGDKPLKIVRLTEDSINQEKAKAKAEDFEELAVLESEP